MLFVFLNEDGTWIQLVSHKAQAIGSSPTAYTQSSFFSCTYQRVFSKVRFCRVCGFRVRVWVSDRTYKSSGLGYTTLTELTKVPGIVARAYRTHRSSGQV